jgi:hypothetical protein
LTDELGQQPVSSGTFCKKPDCSGLAGVTAYTTYISMGFNGTDTYGCVNSCQVKVMGLSTTVNGSGPWANYIYTGEACYKVFDPNGSTTGDSGTGDSGTGDSGTGDSGTGDSGTGDSGTGDSGTGGSGTGGSGTGDSGTGDGTCTGDDCGDGEGSDFCKKNPDALACIKLGDPTSDKVIENEVINVRFNGASWGSANAACPAPVHIRDNIYFSYQPACDFFAGVRPGVIAAAFLIAALIVIGAGKGND